MLAALINAECVATMNSMTEGSIDSIVTDPPYHLQSITKRLGKPDSVPIQYGTDGAFRRAARGFMGKEWDGGDVAFRVETWQAAFRVLKPGGHLVAFGGSTTYHHMVVAIERAGFQVREFIPYAHQDDATENFLESLNAAQYAALMKLIDEQSPLGQYFWTYGSGFPKSHDVSKGIDALLLNGSSRTEDIRRQTLGENYEPSGRGRVNYDHGGASLYNGRPIIGTGRGGSAMKIGGDNPRPWHERQKANGGEYFITGPATDQAARWQGWGSALKPAHEPIVIARKPLDGSIAQNTLKHGVGGINIDGCRPAGRFPANLIHDGSPSVLACFPTEAGAAAPVNGDEPSSATATVYGKRTRVRGKFHADQGSAARFFYHAKADKTDRAGSKHPTVKPVDLKAYLVRMVTPPGGTVLDCFAGSGTTIQAAIEQGFDAIGIEKEPEYFYDIQARLGIIPPRHHDLFGPPQPWDLCK